MLTSSSQGRASVELSRLISSGELQRLLESCKSSSAGRQRSSGRQVSFAQFNLPLEEIQKWISEQSASASSSATLASSPGAKGNEVQQQPIPVAVAPPPLGEAPALLAPPGSEALAPIEALAEAAASSSSIPGGSLVCWQHEYERQRGQAEHMLHALECRTRAWVQQASSMQAESFRLRDQALVDEGRLAALEQLLVSTVDDLHRQQQTSRQSKRAERAASSSAGVSNGGVSKRSRRQNHRVDQKSVLMEFAGVAH